MTLEVTMEKTVEIEVIKKVLMLYGFDVAITEQKSYIHAIEDNGWSWSSVSLCQVQLFFAYMKLCYTQKQQKHIDNSDIFG